MKMRKTRMNEDVYKINQRASSRELITFQICGTTYPDKSYRISRPNSAIACIEYVEEGSGSVSLDGKVFAPHAGDCYFLQAGKTQLYHSSADSPWKKHFVNLSGRLVESLAEGYGVSDVSYFEGLDISAEMAKIIEIGKSTEDRTEELIHLLNAIFFKMHNHTKTTGNNDLGTEMKDFLNSQLTLPFRIESLCKHVSKSESQTIRIFKNAFGITPYAYVLNKKISLAKQLLSGTSLSVKQISSKLCFADEYYFSTLFKEKTGISPSEYRKNLK